IYHWDQDKETGIGMGEDEEFIDMDTAQFGRLIHIYHWDQDKETGIGMGEDEEFIDMDTAQFGRLIHACFWKLSYTNKALCLFSDLFLTQQTALIPTVYVTVHKNDAYGANHFYVVLTYLYAWELRKQTWHPP
ncbi:hypothetical protein PROFUN_13166, partial [Planoprotostelium fungivorum]